MESAFKKCNNWKCSRFGNWRCSSHANLTTITGTVQGVGQGNSPTFAGLTIADGTNDINIASHDGSNGLKLGGTLVTSSAAELNLLDGVTDLCTQAELDARVSAATTEAQGVGTGNSPSFAGATINGSMSVADGSNFLNIISHDGSTGGLKLENTLVTSTAAELNILDGCTATATELNKLDGVTATTAELNYNDITTLGTSEASKCVTASASGHVTFADGAYNVDIASHDGTNGLKLGGTLVTASATELNLLDGQSSLIATSDLDARVSSATTAAQGVGTGNSPTFAGGTFNGNVSFGDNNITNVGDVALDTITADGSSITINTDTTLASGVDIETSTTGKIKQKGAFMQNSFHQAWVLGG